VRLRTAKRHKEGRGGGGEKAFANAIETHRIVAALYLQLMKRMGEKVRNRGGPFGRDIRKPRAQFRR